MMANEGDYAGPWSEIKVEDELVSGEKLERIVVVPFSEEEIATIKRIKDREKRSLAAYAREGSGAIRQFYENHRAPWGYSLEDRGNALSRMRRSLLEIDELLSRVEMSMQVGDNLETLRGMREDLAKLVLVDD